MKDCKIRHDPNFLDFFLVIFHKELHNTFFASAIYLKVANYDQVNTSTAVNLPTGKSKRKK